MLQELDPYGGLECGQWIEWLDTADDVLLVGLKDGSILRIRERVIDCEPWYELDKP